MNSVIETNSPAKTRPWRRLIRLPSLLIAFGVLLTLFAKHHWLADLLANLRMQQLISTVFILLIALLLRSWRWGALLAVCCVVHMSWFLRDFGSQVESTEAGQIKVLLANVLTENQAHQKVIDLIKNEQPDVFAILELSSALGSRLKTEFGDEYRYQVVHPEDDGNFGIGLYSKFPLTKTDSFTLNVDILSVSAVVQKDETSYRIYATHPLPPMSKRNFEYRNEHLVLLAKRIAKESAEEPDLPIIMVGDLNLTPWSPYFGELERMSGLRRAVTGVDVTPTWYRFPIFPFGLVLDHVLISKKIKCSSHKVGPDIGSDHRPVVVELSQLP